MANWLLGNQDEGGALQDYREDSGDDSVCNEDSNMEYALVGLAAAYRASGDGRYLTGLEKGIRWLAERQDISSTEWKGSWFYVYSCHPPYSATPSPQTDGVKDVRGVDSTGALFVYLLYLHQQLSHGDALVTELADHAKAALDFVIEKNMDTDGCTFNSWQLKNGGWTLYKYKYTADQADVYLGMRAGGILFNDSVYGAKADTIQQNMTKFFDDASGRYAEGIDEKGDRDFDTQTDKFDVLFPQGYLPWVFGSNEQNLASYQWLKNGAPGNGSAVLFSGDPGYSLSATILVMAATSLGESRPDTSLQWLLTNTFNAESGAVRDTAVADSDAISNVAGFTIIALLNQKPFVW